MLGSLFSHHGSEGKAKAKRRQSGGGVEASRYGYAQKGLIRKRRTKGYTMTITMGDYPFGR